MAVRPNISLAGLFRDQHFGFRNGRREREAASEMTARLNIRTPSQDQIVQYLSGGNQQKVVLGKWLNIRPRVLLLDEPTRGVDVGAKLEIQSIIAKHVEQGCAVLLISSEFEELIEGAHNIVVLQEGRSVRKLSNPGVTEASLIHAIAEPPEMTHAEAAE
jgi:ribose transport system ATP-binding protein